MMTDNELNGRVAVVTGGGSGIGRGICQALAVDGAQVIVADIDHGAAQSVAGQLTRNGHRAAAVACDVADRANVEALADRAWETFGHVDMIFNNAGISGNRADCIDIDEHDARTILDVNLIGVWHGCAVFGRRFVGQGTPANIVNTCSEHGLATPVTRAAFYTASKHALLGLSDVLRQELPDHITVSVLFPGVVASKLTGMDGEESPRFGLSAREVGRRTVDAVKAGEFYIVTHPPVAAFVQERTQEILEAFDRQAPRFDGDERLDTRAILTNFTRNHGED